MTHIILFDSQKTYRKDSFSISTHPSAFVTRAMGPKEGPPVTVTFDSADTGERRTIGGYQARHIKSTITVDPSQGATTRKGKTKIDGWYLDLPGLRCDQPPDWPPFTLAGWRMPRNSGGRDRFTFKYQGDTPMGYPVEETSTEKSAGNVIVNKTELLEISNAPLDDSLFDLPADYTPAPEPMRTGIRSAPASSLHPW